MQEYSSAHYQQDVMEEMARQHEVFFYGPGFPFYDPEDKIEDVISKSPFLKPDLICVGHSWLGDSTKKDLLFNTSIFLENIKLPKAIFLNKEYVLLNEKLDFIQRNKIDFVFSHHHKIKQLAGEKNGRFLFLPFAANPKQFYDRQLKKDFDIVFTGMIINSEHPMHPFRLLVQKKLFHCLGEIWIQKRKKYSNRNIFWQSVPGTQILKKINSYIHPSPKLSFEDYSILLNRSRTCLNSPSTLEIISPRYFECMMSKCIVLCQDSDANVGLFTDGLNCLTVKNDLADFDQKLDVALDSTESSKIVDRAYSDAMAFHTWGNRIQQFTMELIK